jgi:acetamidase/formamidase
MQIKKILTALLLELEKQHIPYALVGSLAFGYWGHRRYSEDIDFLVKGSDLEKIKIIMGQLGYHISNETKNATQFIHDLQSMIDVDFLYANRETSIKMIEQARKFVLPGDIHVRVALPEDLIALKLQAILFNPKRELQDMADIAALVGIFKDQLDWQKIYEYCCILDMKDYYEKVHKFAE